MPAELIELLEFMIHSFGQSVIVENGNQRQRRCEDTGNMQKRVTRRRRFRALKAGKVLESYGRKEIISEVQQTNAPERLPDTVFEPEGTQYPPAWHIEAQMIYIHCHSYCIEFWFTLSI